MSRLTCILLLMAPLLLGGCYLTERVEPAEIAHLEQKLADSESRVGRLRSIVVELEEAAVASGNDQAIAALGAAVQAVREAEVALPAMRAEIAQLKETGGPRWEVALVAAWPLIVGSLKFIPKVGPLLEPIANITWAALRSRRQREQELAQAEKGPEAA